MTQFIHGGIFGDGNYRSSFCPINQVSTYKQDGPGQLGGYQYSRTGNPTRHALETLIAELEEGKRGFAFASGVAATTAIFMLFNKGDHILVTNDVYGGTFELSVK